MKPSYNDLPILKSWIAERKTRIAELEHMAPTAENLAEVRRITMEARDLERSIKELRGTYPYAS